MPSVEMRRSTRVFVPKTVAKGRGDSVRVLRSGRRVCSESGDEKPGPTADGEDWFPMNDDHTDHRSCRENGWHEVGLHQDIDAIDMEPEISVPDSGIAVNDVKLGDLKWGNVKTYKRKRKRLDVMKQRDFSEKKWGNHFVRRKRQKQADGSGLEVGIVGSSVSSDSSDLGIDLKSFDAVVEPFCGSQSSYFSCFLKSLFRYMMNREVRLKELYGFLVSEPIVRVFASQGIRFLEDSPHPKSSGVCKIFEARKFIPMFTVDFSAVPLSFMHLHLNMLLRFLLPPNFLVVHSTCVPQKAKKVKKVTWIEEQIPRIPSERNFSESEADASSVLGDFGNPVMQNSTTKTLKLYSGNAQSRNPLTSRNVQKRSSLRSPGTRKPSMSTIQKPNRDLLSDLNGCNNRGMAFPSVFNRGRRSSIPRNSAGNIKSTSLGSRLDKDSTSCSANVLITESDRCYREDGATVTIELSASKEWLLVVKKKGVTMYTHKAKDALKPWSCNRYTLAMMWSCDGGWKLEFPDLDRRDWSIFKELYKECYELNAAAPPVNIIPVPQIQEVSGYGEDNDAAFSRPNFYITWKDDELVRALGKKTVNYDMDSEDEEWLRNVNESSAETKIHEYVPDDKFEWMIDVFERAYFCHPDQFPDEDAAVTNVSTDLASREAVEAVCRYWMRKRKQKRAALVRVFQCNQPKKAQPSPKAVLRKKRSFKRQASKGARGKQVILTPVQIPERKDPFEDEKKAMIKVKEAKASAERHIETSIEKRQRAQVLMENADLAAFKATMALRIAEAARVCKSPQDNPADFFLG